VQVGDRVLERARAHAARVATLASVGIDALSVFSRPTVAVFTTGDELVPPGMPLAPGQIHDSNRELLMGLLRADGLEPTAWPVLPDDPARLQSMLRDAASSFDVVITCGAVSAGEKDHIPALLDAHGRVHFWKVRMKPGMPLLFGALDRALFLGLPAIPSRCSRPMRRSGVACSMACRAAPNHAAAGAHACPLRSRNRTRAASSCAVASMEATMASSMSRPTPSPARIACMRPRRPTR
jgi:molybdenum cofactor synthesis domain-containing protein